MLNSLGGEDLPAVEKAGIEQFNLGTEADGLLHLLFVEVERKPNIEAEIFTKGDVISIPLVYLAKCGQIDTDAVASIPPAQALYFPVRRQIGV